MPKCKGCKETVEELHPVTIEGKTKRLCEDCAEIALEKAELAEESEAVVQRMMGYKGRR